MICFCLLAIIDNTSVVIVSATHEDRGITTTDKKECLEIL
jgi:hypothetical protein